jgi:hypothetical protein
MFRNNITHLVITILSFQINNCFGYNPNEDHEQLFADFFQAFKIPGNCPTVFCVVHLLSEDMGRHVFVLASSSGLRGHKRTYLTVLESADHALFKW